MRVVLYARVSSHKQAEKDLSVGAQLRALRGFAHEKGWTVVGEFVDKAVSGRTANRPGFKEMLSAVRREKVDAVLVWKLDRLARDVEVAAATQAFLRRHGARLISLHESFDDTPQGRLIAHTFEALAQFYSDNLAQDICRGIREVALRRFYYHGHPPDGYKTISVRDGTTTRKKLTPDEVRGPIPLRMFYMCLSGKGGREISNTLNAEGTFTRTGRPWTPQKIYAILKNPVYCGDLVLGTSRHCSEFQQPLVIRNAHEPLVPRDVFDRVQEILRSRAKNPAAPRWHGSPYLLSGLVRCGKCGAALCGTAAKSGRFRYYTCTRYYKEGKRSCPGTRVRKEKLEQFVLDKVTTVILAPENLARLVDLVNQELAESTERIDAELQRIDQEIAVIQARLARLFDALETGKLELEDLAPRIKDLRKSIEKLENRKEALLEAKGTQDVVVVDKDTILAYARDLEKTLSTGSLSERKTFLASLVKRIVVHQERVEIEYRLPQSQPKPEEPTVLQSVASGGADGSRTRGL
ncbi:recombinase family protein [Candidatus Bipolaricaulota bacterium]|nr:recombinase family protein [Candidatus Bipolaricaulota bacterium]